MPKVPTKKKMSAKSRHSPLAEQILKADENFNIRQHPRNDKRARQKRAKNDVSGNGSDILSAQMSKKLLRVVDETQEEADEEEIDMYFFRVLNICYYSDFSLNSILKNIPNINFLLEVNYYH